MHDGAGRRVKAMVFAAGVGSRLRPLTDRVPKALIEVEGRPLLDLVLTRLMRFGVDSAVVNVHHQPEMIDAFLRSRPFPIPVAISREPDLLDTGGGLKKAASLLAGPEPFFIHNVDVVSGIDLGAMYAQHIGTGALATLAVQARPAGRALLFDRSGRLVGWEEAPGGRRQWAGSPPSPEAVERLGFCGIHVANPELPRRLTETGAFPIVSAYLRLAGEGAEIRAFRADGSFWADVGSPAKLEAIRQVGAEGRLPA